MLKYQYIVYSSETTFKFRLKETFIFDLKNNFGKWQLLEPISKVPVAICHNNILEIKEGYMWDGSTVVGNYYEDHQTLEASLVHDVLYNAKKNPQDIKVPFSLFEADKILMHHLLQLYKNEGFIKRCLFPRLYYLGLITIGIPWKFGNNEYYRLTK